MTPLLVVGLGNPGTQYEYTRHNLGFRVVEALAASHNFLFSHWTIERDVATSVQAITPTKIFLIKPLSFMNESGVPVQRFVQFYKIPLDRLLVVHDDLDLPFGELRTALNRGPAGHNGVTNIIEKLGSQAFHRLRIGIGSNRELSIPAEDYVLQPFTTQEQSRLKTITSKATTEVAAWISSFHA